MNGCLGGVLQTYMIGICGVILKSGAYFEDERQETGYGFEK